MPSLNELIVMFPNNDTLMKFKKQTSESWTNGKYYLCGHIPLDIDDNITNVHLETISNRNNNTNDTSN